MSKRTRSEVEDELKEQSQYVVDLYPIISVLPSLNCRNTRSGTIDNISMNKIKEYLTQNAQQLTGEALENKATELFNIICKIKYNPQLLQTYEKIIDQPAQTEETRRAKLVMENKPLPRYDELFVFSNLFTLPNAADNNNFFFEIDENNTHEIEREPFKNQTDQGISEFIRKINSNEDFLLSDFDDAFDEYIRESMNNGEKDDNKYPKMLSYNLFTENKPTMRMNINRNIINAVNEYSRTRLPNEDPINISDIPIYFVVLMVNSDGVVHASMIVLLDNQMYSLGLGYYGGISEKPIYNKVLHSATELVDKAKNLKIFNKNVFNIDKKYAKKLKENIDEYKIKRAALYTPDYLIKGKSPTYTYDIVDIGVLKPDHLVRISKYLDVDGIYMSLAINKLTDLVRTKVKPEDLNRTNPNHPDHPDNPNNPKYPENKNDPDKIAAAAAADNVYKNSIENVDSDKVTLHVDHLNLKLPEKKIKYSLLTNNWVSESYINCTSFITSIFPNVNCYKYKFIPITDQNYCETKPPLTNEKINKVIECIKNNEVDKLLELIDCQATNSCAIMGGRRRSHKKRRSYKRRSYKKRRTYKRRSYKRRRTYRR